MRKFLFLAVFFVSHGTLVAQKARVFEHFSPTFAFGSGASVPAISYMQTLALGEKFGLRVNSGLRISQYFIKNASELRNTVAIKSSTLTLTRNISTTAINIPVGVELGNRFVAVGVNADLIGLSLKNERTDFVINDAQSPANLSISPQGFNFLLTRRGTLNSEGYIALTPNQNLTLKIGVAYTQATFKSAYPNPENVDGNAVSWDTFVENAFRPFVGLQFNFEK